MILRLSRQGRWSVGPLSDVRILNVLVCCFCLSAERHRMDASRLRTTEKAGTITFSSLGMRRPWGPEHTGSSNVGTKSPAISRAAFQVRWELWYVSPGCQAAVRHVSAQHEDRRSYQTCCSLRSCEPHPDRPSTFEGLGEGAPVAFQMGSRAESSYCLPACLCWGQVSGVQRGAAVGGHCSLATY